MDPVLLVPRNYPQRMIDNNKDNMIQCLSGSSAYWKRWAGIEFHWDNIRVVQVTNEDDAKMQTETKLQTTVNTYYKNSPVVLGVEALDDSQTAGYTVENGFGEVNLVADSLTCAHEFGHMFWSHRHAHFNANNLMASGEARSKAGTTIDDATLSQSQVDTARKTVTSKGWVK